VQLCKFFGAIRSHPYLKFQKHYFTFDFSLFNCFESLQKSEVAAIEWFLIEESIGCDVVCSMIQLIEVGEYGLFGPILYPLAIIS
jgi:hypothetical protein